MRTINSAIISAVTAALAGFMAPGCQSVMVDDAAEASDELEQNRPSAAGSSAASLGLVGNSADVSTSTVGGTVLMGGGVEVGKALEWMIASSGGGDFVVIRVTGGDDYNEYLYRNLGGVDSVETLRIDSEALVYNEAVAQTIRDAEALFIAGGDQYDYVSLWKDTPIEDAINYLRNNKRVPIGGTSAGSAIQGEIYFDAAKGTIRSEDAMANPYDNRVSLRRGGFLSNPYLEDTITDTHYNNPDRRGRHLTFMARMVIDWDIDARGIGIDERTAVVIEADGRARVFGRGDAFFMQIYDRSGPERCEPGRSLDWFRDRRAVEGYKIRGNRGGDRYFDLRKWDSGSGGSWRYYYVDRGRLGVSR